MWMWHTVCTYDRARNVELLESKSSLPRQIYQHSAGTKTKTSSNGSSTSMCASLDHCKLLPVSQQFATTVPVYSGCNKPTALSSLQSQVSLSTVSSQHMKSDQAIASCETGMRSSVSVRSSDCRSSSSNHWSSDYQSSGEAFIRPNTANIPNDHNSTRRLSSSQSRAGLSSSSVHNGQWLLLLFLLW